MSATDVQEQPPTRATAARATAARLSRDTPLVQLVVLIAIFIYGAVTLSGFDSLISIKSMLLLASFLGLAAVGQTVLVLLGHLDLSVPGFIGLGNVLTAVLFGQEHWAFVPTLAVIVAAAIVMGCISGLVVHRFRVQSIVVTLGMNFVLLGAIGVIAGTGITGTAPAWLTRFATITSKTAGVGVPPLVVLWLVVALLAGLILRRTIAGRRVYLTGSNPRAAQLALVGSGRVVVAAFVVSAVGAAITGVLLTGFSGSGDTGIGTPYLFTSLTAVIVGGTSIVGARGDYWRTVIGAIMLTVINTVLLAKGYSNADQQILFGVIILVAVTAYGREPRLRDRI
ncbi:MAG: ABC transporter permease [Solirubrobacteraceae bacterium]